MTLIYDDGPDDPPAPRGFCKYCETNVDTMKRDIGIGGYEYWGCKGNHVQLVDVCVECGEETDDERIEEEEEE
jgi:hypothetical protein